MLDFLIHLFDSEGFTPKSLAGRSWTKDLVISSEIANGIIIIGYIVTSLQMSQLLLKKKKDIPFARKTTFVLLILFPVISSFARIGNILVYKWPAYRFYIALEWLCAIWVSILAYRLRYATEYLISLPSHSQQMEINRLLTDEVKRRKKTQEEVEATNNRLIMVVERLESMIKSEIWLQDKRATLEDLNKMLEDIQRHL